jgi:hypothetical protein
MIVQYDFIAGVMFGFELLEGSLVLDLFIVRLILTPIKEITGE